MPTGGFRIRELPVPVVVDLLRLFRWRQLDEIESSVRSMAASVLSDSPRNGSHGHTDTEASVSIGRFAPRRTCVRIPAATADQRRWVTYGERTPSAHHDRLGLAGRLVATAMLLRIFRSWYDVICPCLHGVPPYHQDTLGGAFRSPASDHLDTCISCLLDCRMQDTADSSASDGQCGTLHRARHCPQD